MKLSGSIPNGCGRPTFIEFMKRKESSIHEDQQALLLDIVWLQWLCESFLGSFVPEALFQNLYHVYGIERKHTSRFVLCHHQSINPTRPYVSCMHDYFTPHIYVNVSRDQYANRRTISDCVPHTCYRHPYELRATLMCLYLMLAML